MEWENRRVEENPDWKDIKLSEEDEEFLDQLLERKKICYSCREEVEADYGQTQVYCEHCQTTTQAVKQ